MIWQDMKVHKRITLLRWALPVIIAGFVIIYQLIFARWLHDSIGHFPHYTSEVLVYGIVGPVVTYLALTWVRRGLAEKEQAEALVLEREHFLASITSTSAEAIISLDEDWIVQTWNRGAQMIFGYDNDQMVKQPFDHLLPIEMQHGELDDIKFALSKQGFVLDHETTLLHRNSARIPVEFTITELKTEQKQIAGYSLVIKDISLRKRQEKMVIEERKRIAGEIHDSFAQDLFSLTLKIDLCLKLIEQQQWGSLNAELAHMKSVLQKGVRDVRRAIFAMQPIELEELGFSTAVKRLVETLEHIHGLKAKLVLNDEGRKLSKSMEVLLFRTLQELLNNVAKHAQSERVDAKLDLISPEGILLTVSDYGKGFHHESASKSGHWGLLHVREQIERLGGSFLMETQLGQGTKVNITLPVRGLVRS